jgi:hypothetical protein
VQHRFFAFGEKKEPYFHSRAHVAGIGGANRAVNRIVGDLGQSQRTAEFSRRTLLPPR